MALHVDVADPGPDGEALVEALGALGFEARQVAPEALRDHPSPAALVVLAGDGPDALAVLDHLRRTAETATVPILLVGLPPDGPRDPEELRGLGADAVYDRPVPARRIVRKIQTLLTPAERLSPAAEAGPRDEPADGPSPGVPGSDALPLPPREPTLRLDEDDDLWQAVPGGATVHGLSERVVSLVREADRRLFPDSPPLELSVIDPGDALDLMLTEDLFAPAALPQEPPPEPMAVPQGPGVEGLPPGVEGLPAADGSLVDATTIMARASQPAPPPAPARGAEQAGSGVSPAGGITGLVARSFLGPDLPALVVAGARQRYAAPDVDAHLGRSGVVRLRPEAAERLATMGLDADLVVWVRRHEGASVDDWLAGQPPGGGAPGLLLALVALDLAFVEAAPVGVGSSAQAETPQGDGELRARLEAARLLAEDGDYFAILGVDCDVSTAGVEAAYEARRLQLGEGANLSPELARWRAEALDALGEARALMSVPRLREAYRHGLAGGDPGC